MGAATQEEIACRNSYRRLESSEDVRPSPKLLIRIANAVHARREKKLFALAIPEIWQIGPQDSARELSPRICTLLESRLVGFGLLR